MKNKTKTTHGFSYSKNMANFEALCWVISSSTNLLFLKSGVLIIHTSSRLSKESGSTLWVIEASVNKYKASSEGKKHTLSIHRSTDAAF